jgi:hypothetical protein
MWANSQVCRDRFCNCDCRSSKVEPGKDSYVPVGGEDGLLFKAWQNVIRVTFNSSDDLLSP